MPAKEKKPTEKKQVKGAGKPTKAAAKPTKTAAPPAKKAKPQQDKAASKPAKKEQKAAKQEKPQQKQAKALQTKEKTTKKTPAQKQKLNQRQRIKLLIQRPQKVFAIGRDLRPHGVDLTRMVRWPRYIRLQRQKRVLMKRLQQPPPLNQFNHTLDRHTAVRLFGLLNRYRTLERSIRKKLMWKSAKVIAEAKKADENEKKRVHLKKALAEIAKKQPITLGAGVNHVTRLVEKNKAKLVVIAHDVDPIELVVWLPALCRKKKIPYCIVKGKARLGKLVHMKTTSCVALTDVRKQHRHIFDQLVQVIKAEFNDNTALLRQWSEQKFGVKHRQAEEMRLKKLQKEKAMLEQAGPLSLK